ncbi:hypothetical protein [Bacillus sp. RS11]|uniref:hypothetical protein n=1 Tax=Lysinibacillus sp. RS11 TaxID=3242682 RepID=UPI0035C76580
MSDFINEESNEKSEGGINSIKSLKDNIIKGMTLYTLPQYLLLVLIYYLMVNSVLNVFKDMINVQSVIPKIALEKNAEILTLIHSWLPFIGLLGVTLFVSGLFIGVLTYIPGFLGNRVFYNASFGVIIGPWLILSYIAYLIFNYNQTLFMFSIIISYFMIEGAKLICKKNGISFG